MIVLLIHILRIKSENFRTFFLLLRITGKNSNPPLKDNCPLYLHLPSLSLFLLIEKLKFASLFN